MIPKELEDIFSEFDDNDFNLCITKIDYSTKDIVINVLLEFHDINDMDESIQEWVITASEPRKNKLSLDFLEFIKINEDHPLLWEYSDIQCQLYYSGQCTDVPKLFYDLYSVHYEIFENYKCFNIPFGFDKNHYKPFQFGSGLLTEGPKKLMLKYSECLRKNGLDFTLIGERPAKYWNGNEYVIESDRFKVLLFGNTYIIAKDFSFVRSNRNNS